MNLDELRPQERRQSRVRWHEAYRGFGRADALVDELARYLRQHDQADTVCSIRVEKRPGSEFYFFLTLETEQLGYVPPETREVLEQCPHLRSRVSNEPLDLDEIRRFASGELKTSALGQSLEYRRLVVEQAPDPFAPDDPETAVDTDGRAEQLLWYLSSMGSGRWSTFATACDRLGLSSQRSASQLARSFRLLGHLEMTPDGQQWSITPATEVRTPSNNGTVAAFATGYRRPHAAGTRTIQRGAPDRLADPVEISDERTVIDHPADALLDVLPDAEEYVHALREVGGVSQTAQRFARFDGTRFTAEPFRDEPGLYEVTTSNGRETTLLFDGTSWRQGDWYGLRYLALQQSARLLDARYETASWTLAIPRSQRPPEVYERALALCSGLVPQCRDSWCTYSNVAPDVAAKVANRLGMSLVVAEE